jgi:competence protein ComEC
MLSTTVSSPIVATATGELKVYMLDFDVHSDCLLVILPNGKNMLIDAATVGSVSDFNSEMSSLGITSFDYVIGTHEHQDHIGGMVNVINNYTINNNKIYYPLGGANNNTDEWFDMKDAADAKGITIEKMVEGDYIFNTTYNGKTLLARLVGPIQYRVDGGSNDYADMSINAANAGSLAFRLKYGTSKALFMADVKETAEADMVSEVPDRLDAQVIKVGHHGRTADGENQLSTSFINLVDATYALITNGGGGPISSWVQSQLQSRDISYWTAADNGTCYLQTTGDGSWTASESPAWQP